MFGSGWRLQLQFLVSVFPGSTITIYLMCHSDYQSVTSCREYLGQFTADFTVPAIAAGSYTVLATDGTNQATATFTVYSALSVSVGPSSVALDVVQSQDFTATPSGGSGGDSYEWYLNGAHVSGQTGPTYSFIASTAGSTSVYATVTDSAGDSATSNTATITVVFLRL